MTAVPATRWRLPVLLAGVAVAVLVVVGLASPAAAQTPAYSREDAIAQLDVVRTSVDETLRLLDAGERDAAFEQAATGYLDHFEYVEIPLRVVDADLTVETEGVFAEVRQLIRSDAPTNEVRDKLVILRQHLDESERRLTDVGVGAPALVFGQSFLIIFREGLEVVLLLAVLLGYLQSAGARRFGKPIVAGVALAAGATVITVILLQTVLTHLPAGRELLETITSFLAVAVLFWVSFWLIQRLDHRRWMEFLKARVWRAISIGSAASLVALGFTAVYREGFETALFYQALLTFGTGLIGWVLAGVAAGIAALALVSFAIFRLGRRVPVTTFLKFAVVAVMVTSVAFLGNAVHGLQEAFVIPITPIGGPRLPIFLAQATGYWPTVQTVTAQLVLAAVYVLGAVYAFVIKPRRVRRARQARPATRPAPLADVDLVTIRPSRETASVR